MSKEESNVAESAGTRQPMDDTEAEGIVGGVGDPSGGSNPPDNVDTGHIPDGANVQQPNEPPPPGSD